MDAMAEENVTTPRRLLDGHVFYDEPVSQTVSVSNQDSLVMIVALNAISPGQVELQNFTLRMG